MKKCLTIAGSDCSGGAGIQADIKTFSALGCYGMSVVASVVAENTCRVISEQDIAPDIIRAQMDAVFEDIEVDGVKVGMLSGTETMLAVAEKLKEYQTKRTVVDPVMVAKGGCALMRTDALEVFMKEIIPLSFLLTPNIPEAETITGLRVETTDDMKSAARRIFEMGAQNVLIKGGHLNGDAVDVLFDGRHFTLFTGERINSKNTHGTGCTLSSAITSYLAKGMSLCEAVERAKRYVTQAILRAPDIGKGYGPINHFFKFYDMEAETNAKL